MHSLHVSLIGHRIEGCYSRVDLRVHRLSAWANGTVPLCQDVWKGIKCDREGEEGCKGNGEYEIQSRAASVGLSVDLIWHTLYGEVCS